MACLCGFLFIAASGNPGEGDATEAPAALVSEAPAQVSTKTTAPEPPPEDLTAEADARRLVSENPDDPNAHVALAEMLRAQGHDRLAMDEYLNAAELFLAGGSELDAALTALQGLHMGGGPAAAGPRAEALAVQAAFVSADNPGIVPLLGDVNERYPEWSAFPAIAARAALYLDEPEEADRWLGMALEGKPGDPLARSVRAEMLYLRGEPVQAQAFAKQILGQPRLPDWLADHLNRMIESPPTPQP
jgi:tetratricopeptide (TPR) repeat protein